MNPIKTLGKISLGAIIAGCMATAAMADGTIINVSFWDKGADQQLVTTMAMGGTADHSMGNMGIKLSQDTAKAGEVTFQAVNDSKETIHEMLVIPLKEGALPPFKTAENEIDEDTAGALGEIEEVDPGKTGAVTFNLAPGKYLLACNIPGHYTNGMWAVLTVQ